MAPPMCARLVTSVLPPGQGPKIHKGPKGPTSKFLCLFTTRVHKNDEEVSRLSSACQVGALIFYVDGNKLYIGAGELQYVFFNLFLYVKNVQHRIYRLFFRPMT